MMALLFDDQTDTTGNPRALAPCGVQPDPIISQQAIVATGANSEDNTRALTARQADCGLSESALTHVEHGRDNLIQEISIREDGAVHGPGIDEEVPQGAQQDDPQDDPQDIDLKRGANADSKRGAIGDPQNINLLNRGLISDPQDVGPKREEQVDPQPTPAPSLQDIDGDDEHEQQSHSGHDKETEIQVPRGEIPPNWQPPTLSYITRELGHDASGPDISSLACVVWRPNSSFKQDSPIFDSDGLLVEDTSKNQPSQPTLEDDTATDDDKKMPALTPANQGGAGDQMPRPVRRDPLNQNQCAALADDSDDELVDADIHRLNNLNDTEDQEAPTYASIAGSSSASGDAIDQPNSTQLTKLPDTGMRQRRSHDSTQSNKRERTPKIDRTPRTATTPSTIASVARGVCTDVLSPIVGNMYVHNSSEEVSPANSNDPEELKTREPDIEEGIQHNDVNVPSVEKSKSPGTDLNVQSSSSSSHQPIHTRTRLARSTSREKEARLAAENQRVTLSRSAERGTATPTTPQATRGNLTPNDRGHRRSGRGKGKSKGKKRLDFR